MFGVARSLLAALLLLLAGAAWAQTGCVPNPNDNGPPFVKRCPLPAAAINSALAAPSITSLRGVGKPSIVNIPTGNGAPITTLSSMLAQTSAKTNEDREFMMSLGLTSSIGDGYGSPSFDNAKVTLYSGFVGSAGSSDGWAANHLTDAYSGFFTGGIEKHTMRTDECDMDNFDVDVPALLSGVPTHFPPGVERPFSACLYISGAPSGTPGLHRNTYASLITSGVWQFGYAVMDNDLSQAAFYDYTNATYGIDIEGAHTVAARFNSGGVSAQFRHGTDMDLLIRGPIDLAAGNSITSVNDANNGLEPLEFLSGAALFNSALSVNKDTLPTAALDVAGDGKFSGDLAAVGAATLSSTLAVTGLATLSGGAKLGAGLVLTDYTAATLPACNSNTKFTMVAVSDLATTPVYSATINAGSGGGAVPWPVFCNGTNWTAH
jgi:hypothetical protein